MQKTKDIKSCEFLLSELSGTIEALEAEANKDPWAFTVAEQVKHLKLIRDEMIKSANEFDWLECAQDGHRFRFGTCQNEWCKQICQDCDGKQTVEVEKHYQEAGEIKEREYTTVCECSIPE